MEENLIVKLERMRRDLDKYLLDRYEGSELLPLSTHWTSDPESASFFEQASRRCKTFFDQELSYEDDFPDEQRLEESSEVSEKILIPQFFRKKSSRTDLNEVLSKKTETFSSMLLRLIDERHLKDADVYKRANIDRRLFSKIRSDSEYTPSKKTVIAFCFALQLSPEESKDLLKTAGYALSTASKFDLIISYLLETGEYDLQFVNLVLDEYAAGTLFK